jgi:hypothetical protein
MLTAVVDAAGGSVALSGSIAGAGSVRVSRSLGQPVRVADPWPSGSFAGLRDYECPLDTPVTYTMLGFDPAGKPMRVSEQVTVTLPGNGQDWLRPVTHPRDGMMVIVQSYPQQQRDGRVGLFDVLNASSRVAVTAPRGLPTGVLTVVTQTQRERTRMIGMLATGEPLVFLTPGGEGVSAQYLVADNVNEERVSRWAGEWDRRWVMQVSEIDYPAGSVANGHATEAAWQDVKDRPGDWAKAAVDFPTWDRLAHWSTSTPVLPGTQQTRPAPVGV